MHQTGLFEDAAEELDTTTWLDSALAEEPAEDQDAPAGGYRTKPSFALRPYQQAALDAWLAEQGRGIVVLPTGAGKTVLALAALDRLKLRTLIVVPTIELLHQWRTAIIERLGVSAAHVGVVGDGQRDLRPITVITYASVGRPDAALSGFGLLVCDEAHHATAPSYRTLAERCGAPYLLGITATPGTEEQEVALTAALGPVVYRRAPAELSADGHLAQYRERRVYVRLSDDETLRYTALMTEWRWFLARHRSTLARGDGFGELIRRSASDPTARRALQAQQQARMIALNAEAKIQEVARLLRQHRRAKALVFCEYTPIVERISRELSIPQITYRTAAAERRATLAAFREGRYQTLVVGRVLNEGVDIPDASVAIVVSGNSTAREHIQRLGRVIRPKK